MVTRRRWTIFDAVNIVIMAMAAILFFYPFWQTLVLSFSAPEYASALGVKLLPGKVTLDAYKVVFATSSIYIGYANTLFRTVVGTCLTVVVTYCAAYALSRETLPYRRIITFFIVLTMFFHGGLVPTFLVMKSYGLVGSVFALILPVMTSAWNIIITRNYVASINKELEEAAMVDGAHPLKIVFLVMFPVSLPIISVITIWTAVYHWNAWFDALVYTNGEKNIVLQLVLRRLLIDTQAETSIMQSTVAATTGATIKAATIMVAILPIICIYPFLQKHFTKGIMVGSVKG
ncbi:carbohydrate ABC transporter permease [Paenibacillus thalictri]|uniref:Carbohydrate ABC transporter permease n=1 Tax=Paenibacillus thalictri TaxID=2527873 RepID=A0A4Q9DQY7_9BACL|nr:carbohydrate ABC transporter permease [Paenibacillus thalictri]TBL79047.1 carbohydrate ABC transporter permease [Paenibacillus thalictri]